MDDLSQRPARCYARIRYKPDDLCHGITTEAGFTTKLAITTTKGYWEIPLDECLKLHPHHLQINGVAIAPPVMPNPIDLACPAAASCASKQDDVHTVIHFKNMLADKNSNLGLPVILQATIRGDITLREFKNYIYFSDPANQTIARGWEGLQPKYENEVKDSGVDYWRDYTISVLPQTPDQGTKMHRRSGTHSGARAASFFLDEQISGE